MGKSYKDRPSKYEGNQSKKKSTKKKDWRHKDESSDNWRDNISTTESWDQ